VLHQNGEHPISGNRRFGIRRNADQQSFTAYTIAAARYTGIWRRLGAWIADTLMGNDAEHGVASTGQAKLFVSLQERLVKLISELKGEARVLPTSSIMIDFQEALQQLAA